MACSQLRGFIFMVGQHHFAKFLQLDGSARQNIRKCMTELEYEGRGWRTICTMCQQRRFSIRGQLRVYATKLGNRGWGHGQLMDGAWRTGE